MTQQCPERLRVFVVGHDTAFLDPIEKECNQRNYEVAIFHAISFPWNILKKANDCVDIIIIDAQMQDPNSYGFVEYVKQLNEFPLCMMSDDVSEDAMSMAFENGADAIWGKPFGEKHIDKMRSEILKKKAEIKKITSNVKEVHKKKRGRDNIKNGCVEYNNDNYQQKTKFEWTTERREQFEKAVNQLGLDIVRFFFHFFFLC
ncbi:two-component response regulator ARR14 [Trifolium repens]|nr:two-component response regulator ARR14 [Trifolium repens]